jgi:hypothetical protein
VQPRLNSVEIKYYFVCGLPCIIFDTKLAPHKEQSPYQYNERGEHGWFVKKEKASE